MIVSQTVYIWFVTLLVFSVCAIWTFVDTRRLLRAWREDRSSPVVRDKIFGSLIGLAITFVGMVGAVAYHL